MSAAPTISLEQDRCNIVLVVDTSGTNYNASDVTDFIYYSVNDSTQEYKIDPRARRSGGDGPDSNIVRIVLSHFGTNFWFIDNTTYTLKIRVYKDKIYSSYSNNASIVYDNSVCIAQTSLEQIGCNIVISINTSLLGINNEDYINDTSTPRITYRYNGIDGYNFPTPTIDPSNSSILKFTMSRFGDDDLPTRYSAPGTVGSYTIGMKYNDIVWEGEFTYQANICNPPPPASLFSAIRVIEKSVTLSTIPGKFKVTYGLSPPPDMIPGPNELEWDVLSDKNDPRSSVKRDLTTTPNQQTFEFTIDNLTINNRYYPRFVLVNIDSRIPVNQLATPNNDAGVILSSQAAAPIVLKAKKPIVSSSPTHYSIVLEIKKRGTDNEFLQIAATNTLPVTTAGAVTSELIVNGRDRKTPNFNLIRITDLKPNQIRQFTISNLNKSRPYYLIFNTVNLVDGNKKVPSLLTNPMTLPAVSSMSEPIAVKKGGKRKSKKTRKIRKNRKTRRN